MLNHFFNAEEHSQLVGVHEDMDNEVYHRKAPGISSSMPKALASSPIHFWNAYVNPEQEHESTPAQEFGTQSHTFMLENHKFFDENVLAPEINKRTKAGKEEWEAFQKENAGKLVISKEKYEQLVQMREVLFSHRSAVLFLNEEIEVEWSGFWVDERTGLIKKYRPDARAASGEWIIDYKTCQSASPEAFGRAAHNFGYHNSCAWYIDGDEHVRGVKNQKFAFICQETTAPFAVAVYTLDPDAIALGQRQNDHRMRLLKDCLEQDYWPSYSEDQVTELYLPAWAMR